MEQQEFLPGQVIPQQPDGAGGTGQGGQIEHRHLHQQSGQLGSQHSIPADRVGQQELGGAFLLLPGQGADALEGGKESAPDHQHIAALDGIKAHEGAKVEPIHAKGGGKGAHGGKQLVDAGHLPFHLRVHSGTDRNKPGDGGGPDRQGDAVFPQFVSDQGHTGSPPFS